MTTDTPPPPVARGRGRPPVGVRVDVRLPTDVLAEVDAAATDEGVPRAEMLRRLIVSGLP